MLKLLPKILGIIPARYASTRFPAKPLVDIKGKTMIQRVYEQSTQAKQLSEVIVATDNDLIFKHVQSFGGKAVMTSEKHPSGTDRCHEAYQNSGLQAEFVINIQGDEPFIKPEQIDILASCLKPEVELATLAIRAKPDEDLYNPNTAKLILNNNSEAIYFSRHPIPYVRNFIKSEWNNNHSFLRHVGIYAYRTDILDKITKLRPSKLELAESLEQLRWIENGYKIKVQITDYDSHGIDTPEDLERVLRSM
ncbi:MAG: 3-deoxy-manno-octulosonate cytidylyltransferase [Bacteroidota bacterium]|nr:3-deoxy-manno-octulosonate cytidylyltransferase [Bacteroidota bacterium]